MRSCHNRPDYQYPAREDLHDGFFDLHNMEAFADEEEDLLLPPSDDDDDDANDDDDYDRCR